MKKTIRAADTSAWLKANTTNATLRDLDGESDEPPVPELPLPKWSDDRGMLEWLCRKLEFEDEKYWEWNEVGEALELLRDRERHAINDFEEEHNPDRLIAILNEGRASPRLQKYLAQLLGLLTKKRSWKKSHLLTARKSLLQRRTEDFPIWLADRDVPRIRALWLTYFKKDFRGERASARNRRAKEMALKRWVGADIDEERLADLVEKLETRMKRSVNDSHRI